MADAGRGLLKLRPVTFRYQKPYKDGSKPIDSGLIAEEVAEVYPDLVVKARDGQIETLQYHKLIPMLLNELQRLQARVEMLEKAGALNGVPWLYRANHFTVGQVPDLSRCVTFPIRPARTRPCRVTQPSCLAISSRMMRRNESSHLGTLPSTYSRRAALMRVW